VQLQGLTAAVLSVLLHVEVLLYVGTVALLKVWLYLEEL
jgi:hypothetical protein